MGKKWTEQDVLKIMEIMRQLDCISINTEVKSSDNEVAGEIGDFVIDHKPGPQELAEQTDLHRFIMEAISKLPPRQQAVIKLRYGLENGSPMTLEEIGKYYSVTRERIRQIEKKALSKLRWLLLTKYKINRGDL